MHTTFPEAHKIQQQTCKISGWYLFGKLKQVDTTMQALWVTQPRDFLPHSRRKCCCLVHTTREASTSYSVGGQPQQGNLPFTHQVVILKSIAHMYTIHLLIYQSSTTHFLYSKLIVLPYKHGTDNQSATLNHVSYSIFCPATP